MQYLGLVDDEDGYDDEDDDGRYHEPEVERRSERYSQPEPRREVREVRVAREPRDEPEVRRYDAAPAGGVATAPRLHKQTDSSRVRPVPVAPSEQRRRPVADAPQVPYRITTLQPSSYNEARQIGEEFRDGTPVIMNLTEMEDGDAKRLVDFAAGLIFGLRGSIEKVTSKVFLLSPGNVEVSAEDKRRIAEGGFYNQS